MILLLALGWLWALPVTLLGALIALVTLSMPYTVRAPAVIFRAGPVLRWVFRKFAPNFQPAAMTYGGVMFTWFDLQDQALRNFLRAEHRALVRHEMVHVKQAMIFGPLFPVLYLGSMLVAWVQGKQPYRECWFEAQAYRAEVKR